MSSCLQTAHASSRSHEGSASAASSRSRPSSSSSEVVDWSPPAPVQPENVRLAIAVDDDERHLVELGVADPLAERVVAVVDLDAIALRCEAVVKRGRVLPVPLADWDHPRLHRRDPERERAGVVLDEDPDEALERAEKGPVDDEDAVLPVVCSHVREPEPRRHLGVELDGPDLPTPAEHVGHVKVDLRPVERALARTDDVRDRVSIQRGQKLRFGEIPLLVAPELVVGSGRQLSMWPRGRRARRGTRR